MVAMGIDPYAQNELRGAHGLINLGEDARYHAVINFRSEREPAMAAWSSVNKLTIRKPVPVLRRIIVRSEGFQRTLNRGDGIAPWWRWASIRMPKTNCEVLTA